MKLSWNVCMKPKKLKMHTTGVPTFKKNKKIGSRFQCFMVPVTGSVPVVEKH